jgi:hypothetical protein
MPTSVYPDIPFRPRIGGVDILRIYNREIENCIVVVSQDHSKCTLTRLYSEHGEVPDLRLFDGLLEELVGRCFLARNNELYIGQRLLSYNSDDPAYVGWKLEVVRVAKNTFTIVFDPNPPKNEQECMERRLIGRNWRNFLPGATKD